MATTSQDVPAVRHFRNFVIITFLIAFILSLCFYLTGTLVIISIGGSISVIKQYIDLSLLNQFIHLAKTLFAYWKFYIENSSQLSWSSYSYFAAKLWIFTLLPFALLAMIF